MALPLPHGQQIQIIYKKIDGSYEMPSMEAAMDHYSIGIILHGDRKIITPTTTYTIHSEMVSTLAPYLYHKTMSDSEEYYECILIKFSPDFVKPMEDKIGLGIVDKIYKNPIKAFTNNDWLKIKWLAEEMLEAFQQKPGNPSDSNQVYWNFKLQNLLYSILLLIFERSIVNENASVQNSGLTKPILDAVYYVEENYMHPLKIEQVAEVSGYSVSRFSKLFQMQMGTSFSDYLCNVRLKHVQDSLLSTDKSITDIALENGFSYPGNMTWSFKQHFNMTPMQFRKRNLFHK